MDIRRRALLKRKASSNEGPINIDNYLTIEARENGLTVSLSVNACEYCIDGDGNWKSLTAGAATKSINTGQTLSFRGNLTPISNNGLGINGIGTFTISKKCNLKGNCMSMLYGDNAVNNYSLSGKYFAFYDLFRDCTNIVNVSNNFLPATTLESYCYQNMFYGCTSLVNAPELPATTLLNQCYRSMFGRCSSLTTAPELPATTLVYYCYSGMFNECSSLTTAPELPATTLDWGCYRHMFADCTGLKTAPTLPVTNLSSDCYYYMFKGCTSLTTAPELPATTLANSCYRYMFKGCTSLKTAPELPATTLGSRCYESMFDGCTSLTKAPALPATTLEDHCYDSMFSDCKKLNYIKMLATDISASNCLSYWLSNVSSSGTFVKNPAMTTLPTGSSGIPSGWTVVNDGEENNTSISLCDVAYWDGSAVKTCSYNNYNTSLGTAIGVVVIPSGFAPDGKARIIGLKPMDASGNMTDSHTLMTWGGSTMGFYTDTTLTNYTVVPITDNAGSTSSGSNHVGHLPSDKFTGTQSYVDPEAKYNHDDYLIPSPYLGDAPNSEYYKTISGNNVLSDFNGLNNTQTLVGLGSSNYQAANACWNYTDGTSSNVQWYLPAMGELGYLIVRLKAINEVITSLGGVAVDSNSYFWSSSEYSGQRVWAAHFPDGAPSSYSKSMNGYMYAFATIDNGSTNLITFTINNTEYQAEEGMTWEEWVNSEYSRSNTTFVYTITNNIVYEHLLTLSGTASIVKYASNNMPVFTNDVIQKSIKYRTDASGGAD